MGSVIKLVLSTLLLTHSLAYAQQLKPYLFDEIVDFPAETFKTYYLTREKLCFAKRYKTVQIKPDGFPAKGSFSIALFNGETITFAIKPTRGTPASQWVDADIQIQYGKLILDENTRPLIEKMRHTSFRVKENRLPSEDGAAPLVVTVSAHIPTIVTGRTYVIAPIPENPRFHYLYEQDPAKVLRIGSSRDSMAAYEAFRDQLEKEKRSGGSAPINLDR